MAYTLEEREKIKYRIIEILKDNETISLSETS